MSINFDVPETGRSPFSGSWLPADLGFKAMTSDPGTTISGLTLAAGQINAFRIRLLKPETLTGVVVGVQTAGATLTSGQNLAGLYSTAGVKLAETATQHTAWTTAGWRQAAWTSPYSAAAGDYFIALVYNGTTSPQFCRPNNVTSANGVLTTPIASLRAIRTSGSGNTSLPSSTDFAASWEAHGTMCLVAVY